MTRLWHVREENHLGNADRRVDWFAKKVDAENKRREWLAEWREMAEDDEDIDCNVSISLVEIPTTREELARWLFAFDVRA